MMLTGRAHGSTHGLAIGPAHVQPAGAVEQFLPRDGFKLVEQFVERG